MEANLSLILQFATLLGIVFGVFLYFRKPQEDLETKQALTDKDVASKATVLAQKELETKALVLAEQVKSKNEENERRFSDMGIRLDTAMTVAQNHIHSVDLKCDKLIEAVNSLTVQIAKMETTLNERTLKK
jgi:hypothetical protein